MFLKKSNLDLSEYTLTQKLLYYEEYIGNLENELYL